LLYSFIDNGNALETGSFVPQPALWVEGNITTALYTLLLPQAFILGEATVVVLSTDYACTDADSNPLFKDGYLNQEDEDAASRVCVGDVLYYLVGAYDHSTIPCVHDPDGDTDTCDPDPNTFDAITGIDSLDGKSWGGVTVEMLVLA
jgi:hypothetical protein